MSLMTRCIESVNIGERSNKENSSDDLYLILYNLVLNSDIDDDLYNANFNKAIDNMQADVLQKTEVVFTTLSISADKTLVRNFKPDWLICDEIGATQEGEFLIPIVVNLESLKRIIGVGDINQLAPVVMTLHKCRKDQTMVNEFAESLAQPFILRAQLARYLFSMFTECFWCTHGLEQPASELFYQNRVTTDRAQSLNMRIDTKLGL